MLHVQHCIQEGLAKTATVSEVCTFVKDGEFSTLLI